MFKSSAKKGDCTAHKIRTGAFPKLCLIGFTISNQSRPFPAVIDLNGPINMHMNGSVPSTTSPSSCLENLPISSDFIVTIKWSLIEYVLSRRFAGKRCCFQSARSKDNQKRRSRDVTNRALLGRLHGHLYLEDFKR